MTYKKYKGLDPIRTKDIDAAGYSKHSTTSRFPLIGSGFTKKINSIASTEKTRIVSNLEGKSWDNLNKEKECWHLIGRTEDGAGRFCSRPVVKEKSKCEFHLKK